MVAAKVSFCSWPIQFDELNTMILEVRIGNSLCAFHFIRNVLEVINNFLVALHDFTIGKPTLFIAKVPLDLPIPLVSIPPTIVPSWNYHIDNYV
jgi:hypothetical protein